MKNFLILVFLLAGSLAFCQNEKFKFGVAVAPHFSDFFYNETPGAVVASSIKRLERVKFGYSASGFLQYQFNEKWAGQVGFGYARTGFSDKKRSFIIFMPDPAIPDAYQSTYNFQEMTLPIVVLRNFSKKKHKFYGAFGLVPNFTFSRKKKSTSWFSDGSKTSIKSDWGIPDARNENLNALVGLGYNFQLGKKSNLLVQPTFEVNAFEISKSPGTTLNRRIFKYGLQTAFVFR